MLCFLDLDTFSFNLLDLILPPVYISIILIFAIRTRNKYIAKNPIYKYYIPGLLVKMFGAITICLIYVYYYKNAGDTVAYFVEATYLQNLLYKDIFAYLDFVFVDNSPEKFYSYFDESTGYPWYFNNHHSFQVVKIASILMNFTFESFINTAIVLSTLSYLGIWKLYLLFCGKYPVLYKQFAFAILFLPSVVFWGSGILKDTITLSATCWYTYSFYQIFIGKSNRFINTLAILLMVYFIVELKPYIFIALVPGSMLWLYSMRIKRISNKIIKLVLAPFLLTVIALAAFFVLTQVSSNLGQYSSVDNIVDKAQATQRDFTTNKNYGDHYFDIGEFDGSYAGFVNKFPAAVVAGLFRPFIWEIGNIVMLIAAIENSILMGLTIYLMIKIGVWNFVKSISKEPLLFFSIVFSLFFAFSVGLTTANFGALVRYKIPAMPFFMASMLILNYHYKLSRIPKSKRLVRRVRAGINTVKPM